MSALPTAVIPEAEPREAIGDPPAHARWNSKLDSRFRGNDVCGERLTLQINVMPAEAGIHDTPLRGHGCL
jgi:NifU-like protein involved in Fe-S cluster formation